MSKKWDAQDLKRRIELTAQQIKLAKLAERIKRQHAHFARLAEEAEEEAAAKQLIADYSAGCHDDD